jgi:tryptophan synthase alpha chain
MGYLNSVLQFGIERFYRKCSEVGIDGVILPDVPVEEFKAYHQDISEILNIRFVFLVSPDTSPERIKSLDGLSSGFLYVLSSNSTTGGAKGISAKLKNNLSQVNNPVLIGFGIKGNKEFAEACEIANGAIIGSAFVDLLSCSQNYEKDILDFTHSIKHKLMRS